MAAATLATGTGRSWLPYSTSDRLPISTILTDVTSLFYQISRQPDFVSYAAEHRVEKLAAVPRVGQHRFVPM